MCQPVERHPNTPYFITRGCHDQQLRLRPDDDINAAIGVILARACETSGVKLIAFCAMSNHVHMTVYDEHGTLTEFLRDFHGGVGRFVNAVQGTKGHLWDGQEDAAEPIGDLETLIKTTAYTLANPTSAGLVAHPSAWPGVITDAASIGRERGLRFERPGVFFRPKGPFPAEAELRTFAPPGVDPDELRRRVAAAVDRRVQATVDRYRREGKPFLGVPAILAQDPHSRPKHRHPVNAGTEATARPRNRARDPEVERAMVARTLDFRDKYHARRKRIAEGERDVVMPPGTYRLWRHYGYAREESDPLQQPFCAMAA